MAARQYFSEEHLVFGDTTRRLRELYAENVNEEGQLPAENVASVMHTLGLYPSRAQVDEMLRCSSKCSSHGSLNSLGFSEFAVLVAELEDAYKTCHLYPSCHVQEPSYPSRRSCNSPMSRSMLREHSSFQVFLGGSCNPTTWRKNIAIPFLKEANITFYNPQVPSWGPELLELEDQAKEASEVLFFVVDNETRSVSTCIEVAYYAGCRRQLVVVMKPFPGPGIELRGEVITQSEFEELNDAQITVQDLLERQSIPVFDDLDIALQCTAKVIQKKYKVQELSLDDGAEPIKHPWLQVGKRLITLREAFLAVEMTGSGILSFEDMCLAYRSATNLEFNPTWLTQEQRESKITFDQFCCIWVEFRQKAPNWSLFDSVLSAAMGSVIRFSATVIMHALMLLGIFKRNRAMLKSVRSGRDIYIGGICLYMDWTGRVIARLKKHGVTYYDCLPSSVIRLGAQESCKVLLYVIPANARAVSLMAEASFFIGQQRDIVLCVNNLSRDVAIDGETLSERAVRDYNRGRAYLSDIANREGVPVFDDVMEAVNCAIKKVDRRSSSGVGVGPLASKIYCR